MSPLESIVEDLQSLPPARLEVTADFVHRLKRIKRGADAMDKAIREGCEQINEHSW